jgi:hypothetical protein
MLELTNWSPNQSELDRVFAWLDKSQPRTILEIGSGASTTQLEQWCIKNGATLESWEHDRAWAEHTRAALVDPLIVKYSTLKGRTHGPWYRRKYEGQVDFVFIDGPPIKTGGRMHALYALRKNLKPDTMIVLHDVARPHEQLCMNRWCADFGLEAKYDAVRSKGIGWIAAPHVFDKYPGWSVLLPLDSTTAVNKVQNVQQPRGQQNGLD